MTTLLEFAKESADAAVSLKSFQEKVVAVIAERLPSYNWTGFCMLDPDDATMLALGLFIGARRRM
jgi:L-methionine (R)-S-oxide reductase